MLINHSELFDCGRDIYSNIAGFLAQKYKAPLPIRYFFELTHRCNLKCPYCYLCDKKVEQELSFDDWLNIIKQIPRYSFVTLVGGEPLLREDFCEILRAVSKRTFNKTHIVTNGILLNDKIISSLIQNKLMLLSVSLDGWKDNHDKNRGAQGIFQKITTNLDELAQKCKYSDTDIMIDIKSIVLKDNLSDLVKLYEYATNKGYEFFSISFLRNNNLKQHPELKTTFGKEIYAQKYPIVPYFDMVEFERAYHEIQKIKKYSKTKIRFAPKFDNHDSKVELETIKRFFTQDKDKNVRDIYKPCLYPYSNTIINPMGDVYPCLSYKMGNVKEQKLSDIINDKKYRLFRRKLDNLKVFECCQMCCELKVKENQ